MFNKNTLLSKKDVLQKKSKKVNLIQTFMRWHYQTEWKIIECRYTRGFD